MVSALFVAERSGRYKAQKSIPYGMVLVGYSKKFIRKGHHLMLLSGLSDIVEFE
jgi:hypothetical protein